MWFIGVEVEQETSAPPPKKNPGSALVASSFPGNFPGKNDVIFWYLALEVKTRVNLI